MSQPDQSFKPAPSMDQGYPPPKPQGSGMSSCLLGCAIFGVVTLLICGGVVWYVTVNAKNWATDLVASVAKQSVDASEMRDADKTEVKNQIDRLAGGFKAGKITGEELGKVVEQLTKSPLFSVLIIYGVEQQYINDPTTTAEEKAEAERILQRIARGCAEGKITTNDLQGSLSSISNANANQPPGQPAEPKEVSKEDLKKCLDDLKKLADDKEIADEPYELNVGAEVKRIVDEALPGKLP